MSKVPASTSMEATRTTDRVKFLDRFQENNDETPGGGLGPPVEDEKLVPKKKLGMWEGVFVPTVQNVLGIILFLRLPQIVGYAGIFQALMIVWLSCASSLVTSISMSAVATNGVPKGGGAYAIIMSSLGAQLGGVTGILLFLSNTFGVAMYVIAASDLLQMRFPSALEDLHTRYLAWAILAMLTLIVYVGIGYIAKFAILFLSVVSLTLVSIWAGVVYNASPSGGSYKVPGLSWGQLSSNWGQQYEPGDFNSFRACLAIFFPAVTDPLAGSNLSGDLQDPKRAIPPGTLLAVCVTTLIFTVQVILVSGGSCRRRALKNDVTIVSRIAWPAAELVFWGMLTSTLGAGLQSLAGAPRLLAAIAQDNLIPALAPLVPKPGEEPRRCLILCATLSACAAGMGSLNAVAPFITLFFLTCYAIINGACAYLAYEKAPSFRPSFRYFDWRLSFFGVLLCVTMMFIAAPEVHGVPIYAVAVLVVACLLYKYIETQAAHLDNARDAEIEELAEVGEELEEGASGGGGGGKKSDFRAGVRFKQAKNAMLALEAGDLQFKYWRPFVLFFCKLDPVADDYVPQAGMINLIAQLMKHGKGLALVNGVLVSDQGITVETVSRADRARRHLRAFLADREVKGFADVVIAPSAVHGQRLLLQAKGVGFFRPNTIFLGWPAPNADRDAPGFTEIVEDAATFGKTVIVCKGAIDFPSKGAPLATRGRIDVWWVFDLFPAGGLLLLLPFLLMKDKVWREAKLRLVIVKVGDDSDDRQLDAAVRAMLYSGGVIADVLVLRCNLDDAPRFNMSRAKDQAGARVDRNRKALASTVAGFIGGSTDSLDGLEGRQHADFEASSPDIFKNPSKLTGLIKQQSGDAELVVISLPRRRRKCQNPGDWMESVDELLAGLRRVILVNESGQEKVQFFQ